jgi:hypothetical protein
MDDNVDISRVTESIIENIKILAIVFMSLQVKAA